MRYKEHNLPWSTDWVEDSDDGRDINGTPNRNFNFGDENSKRKNNAVETKCNPMCNDFPHKEEAVDHIHFLPESHFLRQISNRMRLKNLSNQKKKSVNFFKKFITLFLMISITIFLKRFAGPQDHLCCWKRKALKVLGSSLFTYNTKKEKERLIFMTYTNFSTSNKKISLLLKKVKWL